MKKQCPECGGNIIGREDKKFCSDYCRNAYNNKVNKDSKINDALHWIQPFFLQSEPDKIKDS